MSHPGGMPPCPYCGDSQCVEKSRSLKDGAYFCTRCGEWFTEELTPPSGGDGVPNVAADYDRGYRDGSISLRDYFALVALKALLHPGDRMTPEDVIKLQIKLAYRYADVALAVRKQPKGGDEC